MGAFSVVTAPEETCPHCGSRIRRGVQFKYGALWANRYAVGDPVEWGAGDAGEPARLVQVMGDPEPCPVCGDEPEWVYDIVVRDGVIVSVERGTSDPYVGSDDYVVVLEQ
ncbi:hypothetical protein [Actinoplanes sp. NBRC 101535]|uniref:hypothetical protein n=1 Tax=Actinoplanes sp. NBRC 101535 TaxID=3032196 RepID=UPI0024A0AABE|nr:hypothetical protein [Actinoplanes sp. NBRC 101535]GLY06289.1 hypothetical protein Acsp01_66680 [Actinoplanes sp. NBRC 101535]